jgi:mono/diheme cytochrome c family protein
LNDDFDNAKEDPTMIKTIHGHAARRWSTGFMLAGVLVAGSASVYAADDLAKKDFINYCAACHGAEAKGDGPLGSFLKKAPADLTMLSKQNSGHFPYQKVRQVIDGRPDKGNIRAHSSHDMPVWGDVFRDSSGAKNFPGGGNALAKIRILNIVDFLASVQQ